MTLRRCIRVGFAAADCGLAACSRREHARPRGWCCVGSILTEARKDKASAERVRWHAKRHCGPDHLCARSCVCVCVCMCICVCVCGFYLRICGCVVYLTSVCLSLCLSVCLCCFGGQFTSLHNEPTPDPCAVAGIFGCNAGAMTHAARGGAGYVNINGYKVMPDGSVEAPGKKHEFD